VREADTETVRIQEDVGQPLEKEEWKFWVKETIFNRKLP